MFSYLTSGHNMKDILLCLTFLLKKIEDFLLRIYTFIVSKSIIKGSRMVACMRMRERSSLFFVNLL